MDKIAYIQSLAVRAHKATGGKLDLVDLSEYTECSRRAFMRKWKQIDEAKQEQEIS